MELVLFDYPKYRQQLLPFTFTRPVSEIRIGILTIKEKWSRLYKRHAYPFTLPYLTDKYPSLKNSEHTLYINASYTPYDGLAEDLKNLKLNDALFSSKGILIALYTNELFASIDELLSFKPAFSFINDECIPIEFPWQIFQRNKEELLNDFEFMFRNRNSQAVSKTNQILGDSNQIFIEEGGKVECSILNTNEGPVYIGKDAEIMEGSVIRGPLALCEHAQLKLSTKIYGATTIGPYCKVGGEINNSVIFGYSNKAHDGFLGNSVIGEWCNLGADTNSSNLKNNYSEVKVFSYAENKQVGTGTQFCGLLMGDHSKSGINTMFNTGTVVGVCANIFGAGFPPVHIPSFSWGGAEGIENFRLDKAFEIAARVMERRGLTLTENDKKILQYINSLSTKIERR